MLVLFACLVFKKLVIVKPIKFNMYRFSLIIGIFSLLFFGCSEKGSENTTENDFKDLAIVDISDESNFDLLVLPKSSSDYIYIEKNENNIEIPKTVLFHHSGVNKDLTILYDEEGNFDKILFEDTTIVLRNFSGNTLDLGIMSPNGEVEILRNVETEFNWDTQSFSKKSNSKDINSWIYNLVNNVSNRIDAVPCVMLAVHLSSVNPAAIPASFDCFFNIGERWGEILADNGFKIYVPQDVYDDVENIFKIFDSFRVAFGCLSFVSTGDGADECIGSVLNVIDNYILDEYLKLEENENEINSLEDILENDNTLGLIAHYPFNGNANDESGNSNNGIVNGATLTTDRHGNPNSAYTFDGVNDFIQVPSSNHNSLGGSDFTISVWFKSSTADEGVIWNKRNTSSCSQASGPTIGLSQTSQASGNLLQYRVRSSNDYLLNSKEAVNDGKWHNAVLLRDGGRLSFYLDGQLEAEETISAGIDFSTTLDLYIGRTVYCSGNYFEGDIDDFRIYGKALSQNEIQILFNE
ncbi:LamG domain-containing protein [Hyunsoonleella sp. SJ7]|uniref:LamG domain-containing protein n=1 Tax=Hyunsoonleella aquatilis TaxID=2762758 RepID=A0A923HBD9_9FLAO|nr:LamG domain-containing protein [Hyunsoonleella aquatilis]MBC3758159.1 LamG domain-containing protein [Hyunsoonleella aquatilis]